MSPISSRVRGSRGAADPRTATWIGVVLGLVLLAAIASYSIFLNQAGQDAEPVGGTSQTGSDAPLNLPDTLPGGFTATDLQVAFAGSQVADQASSISKQEGADKRFADTQLTKVLGTAAVTRTYVSADLMTPVFVQAVRAPGGALTPMSMSDPRTAQPGRRVTLFVRSGDSACTLDFDPTSATTAADTSGTPAQATCQRNSNDLTVTVSVPGVPVATASGLVDDVYTELA